MKKDGTLSEHATKFYFCEIASAIGYLHSLNIAYRCHLSLSNSPTDQKQQGFEAWEYLNSCQWSCKTVWFWICNSHWNNWSCSTPWWLWDSNGNRTLNLNSNLKKYVSPEIASGHMKKAHGLPVDWWSLGCILFEMFTGISFLLNNWWQVDWLGEAPFGDTDKMSKFEIFNNINTAQVSFPLSMGGNLKSLIKGLLEKNQQERFNFSAVKNHPWVSEVSFILYACGWLTFN